MEAVTNSTVLIILAKVNHLDLLSIYTKIMTTSEVRAEVLLGKDVPQIEKKSLEEFSMQKIKIDNAKNKLSLDLGVGETSAIALCCERKNSLFLSDDKKARNVAASLKLNCIGTIGIILHCLRMKKITAEEAKKIVNSIVLNSYYLTTDVYVRVMEEISWFSDSNNQHL